MGDTSETADNGKRSEPRQLTGEESRRLLVSIPGENAQPFATTYTRTILVPVPGIKASVSSSPPTATEKEKEKEKEKENENEKEKEKELLPFLVEIDLRPPTWVEEAKALASERSAVAARVKHLRTTISAAATKSEPEFERWLGVLLEAETRLARLIARTRAMSERLATAGYRLDDYGSERDSDFRPMDIVIKRAKADARQVKSITSDNAFTMIEVKVEAGSTTDRIDIEYDPLATYLSQKLSPLSTVGYSDGDIEGLRRAVGLGFDSLRNGDKDVRYLSLREFSFVDQYGYTLDNILAETSSDRNKQVRMLLVFELAEPDPLLGTTGSRLLVVHNPCSGGLRKADSRVFIAMTFEVTVSQDPGHFLGALAQTVCLAPGEKRTMRVSAENRASRTRRLERRSSSKSSAESRRSVRDELSSSLEKTSSTTKTSKWDVTAGASVGPVSAQGSVGGSNTATSGDTSRSASSRVTEALDSISSQNELSFSLADETTESSSTIQEETVELSNVNVGRTMTYKFFQIMHAFDVTVTLVGNPRIVVDGDCPLIPGLDTCQREVIALEKRDDTDVYCLPKEASFTFEQPDQAKLMEIVEGELAKAKERVAREQKRIFVNSGLFHLDCETGRSSATEPYIVDARDADIRLTLARADAIKTGKFTVCDVHGDRK